MNTIAIVALACAALWGVATWLLGRTIWRLGYEQGSKDQSRNDADNAAYADECVTVDEDHFRELVQQFQEDVRKHKTRSN